MIILLLYFEEILEFLNKTIDKIIDYQGETK
jgi:hypothetical protein